MDVPLPEAPGFEHTEIATSGLRSHVASVGERGGEVVVALHGFPQHWWQWREVGPVLAERGYRVICPDLRGAGWTVADDDRIERESRLHDLVALMDALGVERAHILSHDMGAITGMQLAYAHPERVRTMVQLSTPPFFMAFSPKIIPGFAHVPKLMMHNPRRSLRYLFNERYAAGPVTGEMLAAYFDIEARPAIRRSARTLTRRMIVPESMRLLRGSYRRLRLQAPTLVAFGRRDHPWTEPTLRHICRNPERYADRVEFAFVDDAAHFVTDDAPRAVAALALDWFAQNRPPSTTSRDMMEV